uniref:Uncharacterized protein n=1 Tax=Myotis myotis TaxID=51298 RepID=A0A7J7XHN9_MYOMY|nr:hypothetical protein mMyoMyo1_011779 [Myotis myotis]
MKFPFSRHKCLARAWGCRWVRKHVQGQGPARTHGRMAVWGAGHVPMLHLEGQYLGGWWTCLPRGPAPWCRGSCHKLGFWGSQTSRGSPLRISVSPLPAPHPSLSFSCPDTRIGARLSHGNGGGEGAGSHSLGVGLAPECPFAGGRLGGAALRSYTLYLQEIPEEAGLEQAQLPRPVESPEP